MIQDLGWALVTFNTKTIVESLKSLLHQLLIDPIEEEADKFQMDYELVIPLADSEFQPVKVPLLVYEVFLLRFQSQVAELSEVGFDFKMAENTKMIKYWSNHLKEQLKEKADKYKDKIETAANQERYSACIDECLRVVASFFEAELSEML